MKLIAFPKMKNNMQNNTTCVVQYTIYEYSTTLYSTPQDQPDHCIDKDLLPRANRSLKAPLTDLIILSLLKKFP